MIKLINLYPYSLCIHRYRSSLIRTNYIGTYNFLRINVCIEVSRYVPTILLSIRLNKTVTVRYL